MELGLTTREVGGALGVSQSLVSEWESNKLLIRQPNAMAFELLYGVSWRWLMLGEGEMWVTELPAWAQRLLAQSSEVPQARKQKSKASAKPQSGAAPLPAENLVQVAQNFAITQCQATGTADDSKALVKAFRDILRRLQS